MTAERDALAELVAMNDELASFDMSTPDVTHDTWLVRCRRAWAAARTVLAAPAQHVDGKWCDDLRCGKCYSADFRFKHAPPDPTAAPAQGEPMTAPPREQYCTHARICDRRGNRCVINCGLPERWMVAPTPPVAQPAEMCADRGFAGPSCCTLPRGHVGEHKYGAPTAQPAEPTLITWDAQGRRLVNGQLGAEHAQPAEPPTTNGPGREPIMDRDTPLPEVWVVWGKDGVDFVAPLDFMAQEHANEHAELFPEGGPWRVHKYTLAAPPVAQPAERLQAQLPESMQGCTILFKECAKGHGRLTAGNWIDHGCATCENERQAREIAEWKRKYGDANEWGLIHAAAWKDRAERAEAERDAARLQNDTQASLMDGLREDALHDANIARLANRLEAAERDAARYLGLLAALMEQIYASDRRGYGSPNHYHDVPGIWDRDNGKLAGKPCAECAIYDAARAAIDAARAGK